MSTPAPSRSYGASQLPLANSAKRDASASKLPTKTHIPITASTLHTSSSANTPTLLSKDKDTGRAKLRRKHIPQTVAAPPIRASTQERIKKEPLSENASGRTVLEDSHTQGPLYVSLVERQEQQTKTRILRRKQSVIGNYVSRARATQPAQPDESAHTAISSRESIPLAAQPNLDSYQAAGSTAVAEEQYREVLQNGSASQIHDFYYQNQPTIQTRTPISATSATPSLQYSESSGAFSHTTTPTSRTSHSPLIHSSPHIGPYAWSSPMKTSLEYDTRSQIRLRSDSFASADGRPGSSSQSLVGSVPLSAVPRAKTPQTPANNATPTLQQSLAESALPRTASRPALRPSNSPALGQAEPSKPLNMQRPPELAHLVDDRQDAGRKATNIPARPNTEAPKLPLVHSTPSPVIYSNLPRLNTTRHRRQSSSSNPESAISSSADSSQKQISGRPSVSSPQQRISKDSLLPASPDSGRTPAPGNPDRSIQSPKSEALSRSVSPSVAAAPAKPSSRFGFFSRKPKQPKEQKSQEYAKSSKKGPVAGTGHEGYGRYAITARNGGSSAPGSRSSSRSASASPDNRVPDPKSKPGLDDFLTQRLNPVYIRGDGSVSNVETTSNLGLSHATTTNDGQNDETLTALPQSKTPSTQTLATKSVSPVKSKKSESNDGSSAVSRDSLEQDISADEKKGGAHWQVFSKPSSTPKPANKWNFFHRSGQKNDLSESEESSRKITTTTVPHQNPVRPIAHYAMLGGGEGPVAIEDLENLMQEVDAARSKSIDTNYLAPSYQLGSAWSESRTSFELNTSASNSAIDLSPQVSAIDLPSQAATTASPPPPLATNLTVNPAVSYPNVPTPSEQPRPSRLAQVGRIPPVVSNRDRVRRPSDQSFSRPFLIPHPLHKLDQPDSEEPDTLTNDKDPSPTVAMAPLQTLSTDASRESDPMNMASAGILSSPDPKPREFMSISPRKNSEVSQSSGSISLYFPTAATTAVIPSATSPRSDDEIWEEYDDLIDDVLTPGASATENHDYFSDFKKLDSSSSPSSAANGKTLFPNLASMARELRPESTLHEKRSQSSIVKATAIAADPEVVMKGDRAFVRFAEDDRTSQKSLRNSGSSTKSQVRNSNLSISLDAQVLQQDKADNVTEIGRNIDETPRRTKSVHMKFDAQSMTNLRFGALMTSKWLSFGRVLFSPANFELNNLNEDRVLVMDGLGKDWSFYCALTYSNASVYCLGPPTAKTVNRSSLGSWHSLPNYRYFSHPDLSANFPFPKNFFAAVVFRFPAATSDAKLKATLAECKRVLRPGGYIEVSTLDLDLTNMGNRCRRAVRTLKMQMHTAVPDVSLKPISDNIQHMLGRRGFENLNRCVVGLPAAGAISDSREHSVDGNDPSFTELMKDQSKEGDEGITKMVARVGRWWYSRCYESAVLPNGDLSMSLWNDIALLRECEKRQTAFKLFSCYAQKPTVAKRRTVSL